MKAVTMRSLLVPIINRLSPCCWSQISSGRSTTTVTMDIMATVMIRTTWEALSCMATPDMPFLEDTLETTFTSRPRSWPNSLIPRSDTTIRSTSMSSIRPSDGTHRRGRQPSRGPGSSHGDPNQEVCSTVLSAGEKRGTGNLAERSNWLGSCSGCCYISSKLPDIFR